MPRFSGRLLVGLLALGVLAGCDVQLYSTPDSTGMSSDVGAQSAAAPNIVYGNNGVNPIVQSFTANPSNQVPQGQPITFQVVAADPNDDILQYNWSATGGVLSATSGQVVSWDAPRTAGIYTVTVTVANGQGGFAAASLNLTVASDGSVSQGASTASPAPSPTPSPSPTPIVCVLASPSPSPTPSVSPSPSASPSPTPSPSAH